MTKLGYGEDESRELGPVCGSVVVRGQAYAVTYRGMHYFAGDCYVSSFQHRRRARAELCRRLLRAAEICEGQQQ